MADSLTIATVLCGRCVEDRRRRPAVLGKIFKRPNGAVLLHVLDPARQRTESKRAGHHFKVRAAYTLVGPDGTDFTGRMPVEFEVGCRHHGVGMVTSSDVVRNRGTVIANFKATS